MPFSQAPLFLTWTIRKIVPSCWRGAPDAIPPALLSIGHVSASFSENSRNMPKTSEMTYSIKYNTVALHRDRNYWITSNDLPETRVRRDSTKRRYSWKWSTWKTRFAFLDVTSWWEKVFWNGLFLRIAEVISFNIIYSPGHFLIFLLTYCSFFWKSKISTQCSYIAPVWRCILLEKRFKLQNQCPQGTACDQNSSCAVSDPNSCSQKNDSCAHIQNLCS